MSVYATCSAFQMKVTQDEQCIQVILFDPNGRYRACLAFKQWTHHQVERIRALLKALFDVTDLSAYQFEYRRALCFPLP